MAFHSNFVISTTSSLEGYEIQEYLGTVSSHVVTGTGLFSDFAASFTDIFGGRSVTYQKQLISIKNEVLDRLKREALDLGANSILGLKIDFDEISGKGKTMFMVTAIGTAASTKKEERARIEETSIEKYAKSDLVEQVLTRRKLIKYAENDNLDLYNNTNWELIFNNNIWELAPYVAQKLEERLKYKDQQNMILEETALEKNASLFFSLAPESVSKRHLYDLINSGSRSAREYASNVINDNQLLDFEEVLKMLQSETLIVKKRALGLMRCNKPIYSNEDLCGYQAIIDAIDRSFPELGTKSAKKQMLSSKTVEIWKCKCGKENNKEDEYCSSCGNNISGFSKNELKPEEAKILALNKMQVIKELIS